MASGIARGRVRTTTTTMESHKMAAILQRISWQGHEAVYIGHSCYDQLTPVKTRSWLTTITWPYRRLKCTTHRGHVFLVERWPRNAFSIGSRAHIRLTCWKQDRIVRKPVNASPGLKFIRIITGKTQIKILPFPSWVSLIGHWTARARSYAFRLA